MTELYVQLLQALPWVQTRAAVRGGAQRGRTSATMEGVISWLMWCHSLPSFPSSSDSTISCSCSFRLLASDLDLAYAAACDAAGRASFCGAPPEARIHAHADMGRHVVCAIDLGH